MASEAFTVFMAQIESKPALLDAVWDRFDRTARGILDFAACYATHDILATGCGDSYSAALSMELAFQRLAQVPTRSINAMTSSRFLLPYLPPHRARHTLVIGISVSGQVSRTVEALQLAHGMKAKTIAITANPESPLRKSADGWFDLSVPASLPRNLPGGQMFFASQLALVLMAIRIGEVTGRLTADAAATARKRTREVLHGFSDILQANREIALAIAREYKTAPFFEFLGSGPNYGTALFSATKMVEASGCHAVGEDIEEFHHLHFFETDRSVPVVLFAPFGNAYSRAVEIAYELRKLQRPLIAVVPEGDAEISALAKFVFWMPRVSEELTPFVLSTVGELLACSFMEARGELPFRGFAGVWNGDALSYSGIKTSRQVTSLDQLE